MNASSSGQSRMSLLSEIRQAFGDVSRGSGTTPHEARVMDDYGSEEEQKQARKQDKDVHWWEISKATLEELYDAFTFLDGEGFRYYLPAFMTYALQHGRESDWPVGDWAVYYLARRDKQNEFALLSKQQSQVVTRFLQFVSERWHEDWADGESAAAAIRKYWHRYQQDPPGRFADP